MQVKWNQNGNWLLSASRDGSLKLWDVRSGSSAKELAAFKGHTRDVLSVAWHPFHEELFASGGRLAG